MQSLKCCFTKSGSLPTYPRGAAEQSQWLSAPHKYTEGTTQISSSHLAHNIPFNIIIKSKIRCQVVLMKSTYTKYEYWMPFILSLHTFTHRSFFELLKDPNVKPTVSNFSQSLMILKFPITLLFSLWINLYLIFTLCPMTLLN